MFYTFKPLLRATARPTLQPRTTPLLRLCYYGCLSKIYRCKSQNNTVTEPSVSVPAPALQLARSVLFENDEASSIVVTTVFQSNLLYYTPA